MWSTAISQKASMLGEWLFICTKCRWYSKKSGSFEFSYSKFVAVIKISEKLSKEILRDYEKRNINGSGINISSLVAYIFSHNKI